MAQFFLFTTRLVAVDRNAEPEASDTYLVRFKKPNKMIWVGVIVPEDAGPRKHIGTRPLVVRPAGEGEWTTPVRDRKYSVYLPGCNNYRWLGTEDMFTIEASPPSIKEDHSDKPAAKLFQKNPGYRQPEAFPAVLVGHYETGARGEGDKTTTDLRLCMPVGYNIVLEEDNQSASNPLPSDKRTLLKDSTQEPVSRVQAISNSFSTSRALAASNGDGFSSSTEQDDALFVSADAEATTIIATVADADMNAGPNGDMSTQMSATVHGFYEAGEPTMDDPKTPPVNPPSPEASMKVEALNQPHGESIRTKPDPLIEVGESVFGLHFQDLVKKAICKPFEFLQIIDFVNGIMEVTQGLQGFFIRSFFETNDFSPRLMSKNFEEADPEDSVGSGNSGIR